LSRGISDCPTVTLIPKSLYLAICYHCRISSVLSRSRQEETRSRHYEEEDTCHTSYEEEDTCHISSVLSRSRQDLLSHFPFPPPPLRERECVWTRTTTLEPGEGGRERERERDVTSSYIVSHHHTYNCPFRTRTCRSQVLPPADTDRHSQTQTQARAQTHRKRAQKQRHRQTRSHYFSSIDMYNNDVGKRFMK